ncbi:hypothetical protein OF83DRAFT_1070299 [Amylostereum chailletii]|nr:hypothetical protein OF83DRAFT_1070299 [Amylostereum chailletii]
MPRRAPYHGVKRRLVLAFDLGTTFSGISYAVLDPGQVPVIKTVSRYPGQEAGDSKVQTVIHYDAKGKVVAIGAEELPVDDEWQDAQPQKLEWYLLLRPKQPATTTTKGIPTPRLPPSKDIIDVYADFYAYLFARAREYIQQTHANGDLLWDSVADDVDFVLSHPNGWEGAQQGAMRRAAVKAGLVPDTPAGRERVTFVSEGEASFHYCVASGLVADSIQTGNNVMVIDAGGGTVDLSTYTFAEASPIKIQEIAPPGCIFEGSVIVRHRAEQHLQHEMVDVVRHSALGDGLPPEAKHAAIRSERRGEGDMRRTNSTVDRDVKLGIRNGQIKLSKEEVCGFFDPGIEEIIRAIEEQQGAAAPASVSTYFLVGGFAASEYLYAKLNAFLNGRGSRLFRPDSHTNKAVAEGAVSFHIDHFVQTRVAKLTYGIECIVPFLSGYPKHDARRSQVTIGMDGERQLQNAFSDILRKVSRGTQVSETKEFKNEYHCVSSRPAQTISLDILGYHGSVPPQFMDEEPDSLSTLCTISADISDVPYTSGIGPHGRYYAQRISVAISLGLTELKAQIVWEENVRHLFRGPASVVYDDDFAVTVEG